MQNRSELTTEASVSVNFSHKNVLFLRSPKVLVVEDSPLIQRVMRMHFEDFGCEIDIAQNGLEAIDMFKNVYDLIFLDINMPKMNGIEAAKNIRLYEKNSEGSKNVLIAASTLSNFLLEEGNNASFDDYFCKPVTKDDLLTVFHKWLPHLLLKN